MFDIKRQLLVAQCAERALQRRDIKLELLVNHPRIGAGLLDDARDAAASKPCVAKLGGGRAQDLGPVLLGGAAGAPPRRSRPHLLGLGRLLVGDHRLDQSRLWRAQRRFYRRSHLVRPLAVESFGAAGSTKSIGESAQPYSGLPISICSKRTSPKLSFFNTTGSA